MNVPLTQHDFGKGAPQRVGLMHPTIQPYGAFAVEDGSLVIIAIQNEREWARFCERILGEPGLATDSRFASNNDRVKNVDDLHRTISRVTESLSREALVEQLRVADIAFGSVNSVAQLSEHPALQRVTVRTSNGEAVTMAAPPIQRSIDNLQELPSPPRLEQRTDAVVAEIGAVPQSKTI